VDVVRRQLWRDPVSALGVETVSWQAVTWVLECSHAELGARLVLLSIASHANREGRHSWPSVETICIEARLTRREVQYCLRDLELLGELATIRGGGRGKSNSYELPFVADWLTAQSLRSLEKQRAQTEKGRNLRQETAHPSAHEPFPNRHKEELSSENTTAILSSVGEPSPNQTEAAAEVSRLVTARGLRALARAKKMPRAFKNAAEIDSERRRQLKEMREKGWLQ
jgi:hypothetical protein